MRISEVSYISGRHNQSDERLSTTRNDTKSFLVVGHAASGIKSVLTDRQTPNDIPVFVHTPIDTSHGLCYVGTVNLGDRYRQLCSLGRETFLDSVAEAALVIHPRRTRLARGTREPGPALGDEVIASETEIQEINIQNLDGHALQVPLEFGRQRLPTTLIALSKKKDTPFVDLITIGRTLSNDVTLDDLSVSRFQAFFRYRFGRWFLCDAGSRNGTRIDQVLLKARTEVEVQSGQRLQFGLVETSFHTSDTLYDLLTSQDSL